MIFDLGIDFLDLRYASLRVRDTGRVSRLAASLDQEGQHSPVLVVPCGDEKGRYILIDGYMRVEALRKLHQDLVKALVLEVGEAEALVLRHRMETSRSRTAMEEGWLVQVLVEFHRQSPQEVASKLGRTRSWVSRRLALVKALPEEVQQAVRDGRVCPNAAEKYLVPLARANEDHSIRLVRSMKKLGLRPTVREMGRLWTAWKTTTGEGQERVVDRPDLVLQVQEAFTPPPEDLSLFKAMEAISGTCVRARKILREGAMTTLAEGRREGIRGTWQEVCRAFEGLRRVCVEEGLDVGR